MIDWSRSQDRQRRGYSSGCLYEHWPTRAITARFGHRSSALGNNQRNVRVHRIFRSDLDTQFLVPVDHRDDERLVTLNQQGLEDPLPGGILVRAVDRDDRGALMRETEFPWLQGNIPVFAERAYDRLLPFLDRYGRAFSLPTEGGATFIALRVDRVVDALDLDASEISRFANGRVMTIDRHVFREDAIGGAEMFRLTNTPRAGWTYVTDDYVELVLATDLRGR
jgi:hypothetical protein